MKKLMLILSILLLCNFTKANTAKVTPLQTLIDKSAHIVCGVVINTQSLDKEKEAACKEKYWVGCAPYQNKAKIKIIQELKGYFKSNTISFNYIYSANFICNSFKARDTIIVFLTRSKQGTLITNHCVLNSRNLSPGGMDEYSKRIYDYPVPLLFNNNIRFKSALTEWYVKCAEGFSTCKEGMYKIADINNPALTNDKQKKRLKQALLRFKTLDIRHLELLRYVVKYDKSNEMKKLIYSNLKKLNKKRYYLTAYDLMAAYTNIDTRSNLKSILNQYTKSNYSKNLGRGYAIVLSFIRTIESK